MKTRLTLLAVGLITLVAASPSMAATIVLFDDDPQNGMGYFNSEQSNEQVYAGIYSAKMDRGAWSEAGLIGNTTTDADSTIVTLEFYVASGSLGETTIITNGPGVVYNNGNSAYWTVNGNPGNTGDITVGSWHTLTFDLTLNTNYTPGTDNFARLALKPGRDGMVAYLDDASLVPEPATMSLLAIGGIGVLLRRKRR